MVAYAKYLANLHAEADVIYEVAEEARSKGFDPKLQVEIPKANDLADRTQKLLEFLHPRNTAEQIRELTKEYDGNRERVAIEIAKIVCAESYLYGKIVNCSDCGGSGEIKKGNWNAECYDCGGLGKDMGFKDEIGNSAWKDTMTEFEKRKKSALWKSGEDSQFLSEIAIYHGVCAGLAVLTEGILVAPLEGVVSARFITNNDGSPTLAISFAGPIRSAGGTGQALSVLIADILRRDFGLKNPIMSFEEVERYKEETGAYARGLQHRPSNPEIEEIVKSCPVYIDGEGVGNEVTGQRDLPRVKTNKVREGMLLVVCEGLVLKAPKILKYVDALGLDGWEWLRPFAKGSAKGTDNTVKPNSKFISDVLAGRPIFSLPMETGGFRLRYGRSRLAGLATTSLHPATMTALSGFVIIGTQMKYERPGKGTVSTPCDSIDGPYIQFKDGSARTIESFDDLELQYPTDPDYKIEKIWDLGEILIPVGEFLENNHILLESPYVKEWAEQVCEEKGLKYPDTFEEAMKQVELGLPLAPCFVPFFSDIDDNDFKTLLDGLNKDGEILTKDARIICYRLGVNVILGKEEGTYFLNGKRAEILIHWVKSGNNPPSCRNLLAIEALGPSLKSINFRPRVTYRIGARMGKPEGSKHREMKPPIHTMFPVGHKVGSKRLISDAAKREDARQIGIRVCPTCSEFTTKGSCCNIQTIFHGNEWVGKEEELWKEVSPKILWEEGLKQVHKIENEEEVVFGEKNMKKKTGSNPAVKGVKGMNSREKTSENVIKGILRHKNDISTFRDGTIRFDMVDITMTHFKPKEIGITVKQARELGYDVQNDYDVVELRPQDVVIPRNCMESLFNTTKYLDDLLATLYSMDRFYNCETPEDLVGHLIMGIAPHTSGAILARIIGFADIKGHYGHPFFHAAKRRNCDGDIDAILLLLDGLLNFSKSFLSAFRGGMMDAPLILTTTIEPTEIDKEALNVDTMDRYPLIFYEGTMNRPVAKEATKSLGIETVEVRLKKGLNALEDFGYTHETTDACQSPRNNPYNTLETMKEKTMMQFELGTVIRAVDNEIQAGKLINRHLIRDMRGNLRAYGQQKTRCTKCGASYRRVPIAGKCITVLKKDAENPLTGEIEDLICNHKLILTVHQGSVQKYDGLIAEIIERYGCDDYTENLYHLVSSWVADTFSTDEETEQRRLDDF
ncbi:MAG: DNA polymerase II large subunit [Bacteroidetes bacterium]|nr:DNA polymerase II large subunit [Bacteroidota bacterium]